MIKGILKIRVDLDGIVSIGIWYCLYLSGFVFHDWSCAVELTNYGGGHWGIDNYRATKELV